MAFPTGWARKCIITIPDAQISGSNTNFPILITEDNLPTEMMDGGANSALNGGGDVRFSEDAAGLIQLPCEVVSFVIGGGPSGELWVKLSTLNTGADKIFYVWYKKAGEVQPAAGDPYGRNAVWAGYNLVVHCNNAISPVDSTGNSAVTPNGAITEVAGPFGGTALDFAAGAYLDVTGNAALIDRPTTAPFGFSLWAKRASWANASGTSYADAIAWGGTDDLLFLPYEVSSGTNRTRIFWRDDTGARPITNSANLTNPLVIGTWNHFAFSAVSGAQELYINDELGADNGTNSGSLSGVGPFNSFRIGGWADSSQDYRGQISELRVGPDRSSDWAFTEYNNQSSPAIFATAGTSEAVGGSETLGIQNIGHALASGISTLAQIHSLAIDGITHRIANINPAPTLTIFVSPNGAGHGVMSEAVTLSQGQLLVVSEVNQWHGADSPVLSQTHDLVIWDGGHGHTSDNAAFLLLQSLIAQNTVHGLNGDMVPLFNPGAFISNPARTQKAVRASRTSFPAADDRKI